MFNMLSNTFRKTLIPQICQQSTVLSASEGIIIQPEHKTLQKKRNTSYKQLSLTAYIHGKNFINQFLVSLKLHLMINRVNDFIKSIISKPQVKFRNDQQRD